VSDPDHVEPAPLGKRRVHGESVAVAGAAVFHWTETISRLERELAHARGELDGWRARLESWMRWPAGGDFRIEWGGAVDHMVDVFRRDLPP
jgi:hypothetical protein